MKIFLSILCLAILSCVTQSAIPTKTFGITSEITPTIAQTTLTITASDYLNLRSLPDAYGPTNSSIIATMPAGTHVTWLRECRGTWSKVDYMGLIGWANNHWMKPEMCK